jgi:hypothetical protein
LLFEPKAASPLRVKPGLLSIANSPEPAGPAPLEVLSAVTIVASMGFPAAWKEQFATKNFRMGRYLV